jgi:hypothetical protein
VPLDQITANVRAAGLQPLSRPMLRGAVYYVRAVNPARAEMRVAIDARSGRVLSATRVTHKPPARTASEPGRCEQFERTFKTRSSPAPVTSQAT